VFPHDEGACDEGEDAEDEGNHLSRVFELMSNSSTLIIGPRS
jgi:hypothetical protein